MAPRLRQALAAIALVAAAIVVLAFTGPRPEPEASGSIRRFGGVCVELERWALLGWSVVGQAYTVADVANGIWYEPTDEPPCADVPTQTYLIRMPNDGQTGAYRLCGLADLEPCIEFTRVPFIGTPGP